MSENISRLVSLAARLNARKTILMILPAHCCFQVAPVEVMNVTKNDYSKSGKSCRGAHKKASPAWGWHSNITPLSFQSNSISVITGLPGIIKELPDVSVTSKEGLPVTFFRLNTIEK